MPNYHGNVQHGHKRKSGASEEYKTWLRIKSRCHRETDKDYPRYGGRGIRVADEWKDDFPAFLRDMGPRPSLEHSIDRLDPNKGYEPGNCRWATRSQQCAENKRDLVPVVVDGIHFPSKAAACRHFGLHQASLHWRLMHGYSMEEALKKPGTRGFPRPRSVVAESIKAISQTGMKWLSPRQRQRRNSPQR